MSVTNIQPIYKEETRKKKWPIKGHIKIDKVRVEFGAVKHLAVTETSLDISAGEFVCILGPSGCGKSTLMNCIAGFVKPSEGKVLIDDEPVSKPGPECGMVFQQPSLFPWKTVRDNVAFGPLMSGHGKSDAESTARTLLAMVGLSAYEKRYPATLSGGMKQRVGIARALANYPSVLLMDEPFGALDAQTRSMMQTNLLKIWREFKTTVIFVTHDIDEAIFLGDRVLVMSASPGRIIADINIELDRPREAEVITSDLFIKYKKQCFKLIQEESLRAFANQNVDVDK
jgi:NitT/TauT family transport system ATP-binding protein